MLETILLIHNFERIPTILSSLYLEFCARKEHTWLFLTTLDPRLQRNHHLLLICLHGLVMCAQSLENLYFFLPAGTSRSP